MERLHKGFTLIEILIAVSILILLMMIVFLNLRGQSARTMDSKRKTDLYTLRKSFEDYYNDVGAFPEQLTFNESDCGSADMAPYLERVPCDPVTKKHYGYFPSLNGGYRLCAKLADTTDPAIATMGCTGPLGCGLGEGYNYCMGSGVTASAVGTADEISGGGGGTVTPTASPTPGEMGATTPPGEFACAPADMFGNSYCKSYSDPIGFGCPKTYEDSHCLDECQIYPAVRCIQ